MWTRPPSATGCGSSCTPHSTLSTRTPADLSGAGLRAGAHQHLADAVAAWVPARAPGTHRAHAAEVRAAVGPRRHVEPGGHDAVQPVGRIVRLDMHDRGAAVG